jgi:hypothetical protein
MITAWDSTVTYTEGAQVTYAGKCWNALDYPPYVNLGKVPGRSAAFWGLTPPRDRQDPKLTEAMEAAGGHFGPVW